MCLRARSLGWGARRGTSHILFSRWHENVVAWWVVKHPIFLVQTAGYRKMLNGESRSCSAENERARRHYACETPCKTNQRKRCYCTVWHLAPRRMRSWRGNDYQMRCAFAENRCLHIFASLVSLHSFRLHAFNMSCYDTICLS